MMKRICLVLVALSLAALTGCVERKLTISSDPPGALVTLNDVEIGRTPVTVPIKWYGTYDLRFHYEVNTGTPENPHIKRYYLHTSRKTTTPWFENIPIDLFAELSPGQFKDDQIWGFAIPEVVEPTDEDLIKRAKALQAQMNAGQPVPPK